MHKLIFGTSVILLLVLVDITLCFSQEKENYRTYTVKEGDTLEKIAEKLGSRDFWEPLYLANSDIIEGEEVRPGQVLTLPDEIVLSPEFTGSKEIKLEEDEQQLEKFREAFNQLLEEEKQKEANQEKQKTKEVDPTLDLGVFIVDETRTKMGGDFYDLFYQYWQSPEEVSNASILISEQPIFGRGSLITLEIDYELVYRARLQPRYEYLEELSKEAVARAQQVLQEQAEVRKQLTGF